MKYVFLAAILCLCILQSATTLPQNEKSVIDDMIKQVKEAIERLTQMATNLVNNAIKLLQNLLGEISEAADQVVQQVREGLKELVKAAEEKIKEVQEQAEKLGISVQECVQDEDDEFNKLVNEAIAAEIACVTSEVDTATKLINNDIQVIKDQIALIQSLPQRIDKCVQGSIISAIPCLANLGIEIASIEADLPGKIAKIVAEDTQFVAGLKARLAICASTNLADATLKLSKLTGEIIQCILNKISESSSTTARTSTTTATSSTAAASTTESTTAAASTTTASSTTAAASTTTASSTTAAASTTESTTAAASTNAAASTTAAPN